MMQSQLQVLCRATPLTMEKTFFRSPRIAFRIFSWGLPAAESVLSKMLRAIGVGGLPSFRMEEVISSPLLADRWGNPVIFCGNEGLEMIASSQDEVADVQGEERQH